MGIAESSGVDPKMIIDEKLRKVLQSIGSRYEKNWHSYYLVLELVEIM
jgi:methanogenic corrinoid protein MtbC1